MALSWPRLAYPLGMVLGLMALTALAGLWFWFTPWRFPPIDSIASIEWLAVKQKILATKPSPRLITFGGSNGMYGINTAMIERELGLPAANLSLNSNVDLEYILYKARQVLRPGDIALLSLEYRYFLPGWPRDVTVGLSMLGDREYFQQLPWYEKLFWVWSEPWPDTVALGYEPEGRLDSVRKMARVGAAERFDKNGDYCGHRKQAQTPEYARDVMRFGPINLSKLQTDLTWSDSWRRLREFAEWCRQNDVRLLATFPSTVAYPDYSQPPVREKLARMVQNYQALGIPVLGEPQDLMWEKADFYDTNYHLNEEAMHRRTQLLIEQLSPVLSNTDHGASADTL